MIDIRGSAKWHALSYCFLLGMELLDMRRRHLLTREVITSHTGWSAGLLCQDLPAQA